MHCLFSLKKENKDRNCHCSGRIHASAFQAMAAPGVNTSFVFQALLAIAYLRYHIIHLLNISHVTTLA